MSKRFCKVCGSGYSYCPDCVKDVNKPRWMISFDRIECKKIFDTLVDNSTGKLTDKEAYDIVSNIKVNIVNAGILKHIEKIKHANVQIKEEPQNEEKQNTVFKKEEPVIDLSPKTADDVDQKKEKVEEKVEEKGEDMNIAEPHKDQPLFSNKNSYVSNNKNKEKTRVAAESISSALEKLDGNKKLEF